MRQRWERLLFAHWPIDPALLRSRVPAALELQTFDGAAWQGVRFECRRRRGGAAFVASYPAEGEERAAAPGSLEHWLTERYCVYQTRHTKLMRIDIQHPPWRLRSARAAIECNEIPAAAGIAPPAREPLLHFADRIESHLFGPLRVDPGAAPASGTRPSPSRA